jgi:hypothetical protein
MPKNAEIKSRRISLPENRTRCASATGSIPMEANKNRYSTIDSTLISLSAILPKKKPVPHKVPASPHAP